MEFSTNYFLFLKTIVLRKLLSITLNMRSVFLQRKLQNVHTHMRHQIELQSFCFSTEHTG
jgi:hypothetical protein